MNMISKTLFAAAMTVAMISPTFGQSNPALCVSPASALLTILRPAGDTTPACPTLVGTWEVTVTPDGIPSFTAYNVFNADGNSVEFDNSNPPGQQTIAVGPWMKIADLQYAMVEINQLFDPQGNFAGRLKVKATITLDSLGNRFTSKFQLTVFDPNGNTVFQGQGTASGKRVTLE
jgi:hypothetical protein